ncbi:MAG: hypothetical protein KDC35_05920 [Acidobacteria bacterium]|nr:hypothetical protein [Acidobacteriota bacterium]
MIGTLVFALSLCAGEWDVYFKAEIATELRQFESDDDMRTIDSGTAGFVRLETSLKRGAFSVAARGFGRVDPKDHDRDNASFEELFLSIDDRGWRVRAGYQMLNWTATEAFHPADVMNARNFDSDIENPEKKGELMLSVRRRLPVGSIEAFYMPRMERPELPGSRSRLSFAPPGFSTSEPLWLDDNGNLDTSDSRFQWGLRWNAVLGDADLSLHYLDHQDRLQPVVDVDVTSALVQPYYLPVHEYGGTYSQVVGASIAKLEVGHKDFQWDAVPDHTQVAIGWEYGWISANGAAPTLIMEAQNYFGVNESERAALGTFQRDLLVGYRHAFNDIAGRELLVTVITDLERSHEWLANLRYSQRLSDTWSVSAGLRYIDAPPKRTLAQGLELLDGANQIFLTLKRFF